MLLASNKFAVNRILGSRPPGNDGNEALRPFDRDGDSSHYVHSPAAPSMSSVQNYRYGAAQYQQSAYPGAVPPPSSFSEQFGGQESSWSQWTWDSTRRRYYRHREDGDGESEYQWQPDTPGNTSTAIATPAVSLTPTETSLASPNYRWWISATGVRRDVIQADIQRYLGPEALVKPGSNEQGEAGYWIAAYRTLTASMIQDLKSDSANFERISGRTSYQNSQIHESRNHWGPSEGGSTVQAPAMQPVNPFAVTDRHMRDHSPSIPAPVSNPRRPPVQPAAIQREQQIPPGNAPPPGYYLASDGRFYPASSATPPSTMQPPASAQDSNATPKGYYLASDGNYYPKDKMRR
ncbi:hypothetical protein EJ08DRAFT_703077 [Tothia fuscella]|uniref:Uncharacterized protein n=1 Tax=Tothia fuscella TaxID=1048955 RepID=A0A9P4TRZ6_9PEZI|nr:hypothetical protein EJ08DRAFT_703077 [Tothia fuscella]